MKRVFVDTLFLVARVNDRDQWHAEAIAAERSLHDVAYVTTESVLIELLNFFAGYGQDMRTAASRFVRQTLVDENPFVVRHDFRAFGDALALYESRLDKGYSLTDCISMNVMREMGITDVLTHDRHFAQEGIAVLM